MIKENEEYFLGIKDEKIFERTGSPSLLTGGTSMNLKRVSSK